MKATIGVPTIPARTWNEERRSLAESRPLSSPDVMVRERREGCALEFKRRFRRVHPWQLTTSWEPAENAENPLTEGLWRIAVRPGFLNGRDVVIDGAPLTAAEQPRLTAAFRNPIASAGLSASLDGELVELPGEGYPAFFAELGVRPASRGSRVLDPVTPDRNRTRELRACDVVLVVPRIGTAVSFTAEGETVTVVANALAASTGRGGFLRAQPKWTPPPEPTASDLLFGAAVEPQSDEILLATLWMVSPPDAGSEDEPDGTWSPFPQHFCWWNLCRAMPRQAPALSSSPLSFTLGLALGVGDSVISALQAQVNDANSRIVAFLQGASSRGQFWTA